MEAIEQFAWIGWLVVVAIFLAVEIASGELTFLMLGLGAVFGLVAAVAGAPLWLSVVIAAAAAVALLLLLRPPLLKRLRAGADPRLFNVDALVGLRGVVTETVTSLAGRVKLVNGDSWSARVDGDRALAPQTPVSVVAIQGATAVVTPVDSEES